MLTPPSGNLSPHPLMFNGATLRGIFVGGREHFEGLLRAVDQTRMKPVIDRMFPFDEARRAYEFLRSAKHFGKVVIEI